MLKYPHAWITQEDINKAANEIVVPFGPIGDIVDTRTYRRLKDDNTRETVYEMFARVTNANINKVVHLFPPEVLQEEANLMYKHQLLLQASGSSRNKWIAGTESNEKHPGSSFNCASCAINRLEAFAQIFELLMLGTGIGFRVFNRDISQLPSLKNKNLSIECKEYNSLPKEIRDEDTSSYSKGDTLYVTIGDSRQGWIDSLMIYLNHVTKVNNSIKRIVYNFDSVRPFGEEIKGFGGTASGPQSLRQLLEDIHRIIIECPDQFLRSIDCMDICCAIAKAVVAG